MDASQESRGQGRPQRLMEGVGVGMGGGRKCHSKRLEEEKTPTEFCEWWPRDFGLLPESGGSHPGDFCGGLKSVSLCSVNF